MQPQPNTVIAFTEAGPRLFELIAEVGPIYTARDVLTGEINFLQGGHAKPAPLRQSHAAGYAAGSIPNPQPNLVERFAVAIVQGEASRRALTHTTDVGDLPGRVWNLARTLAAGCDARA